MKPFIRSFHFPRLKPGVSSLFFSSKSSRYTNFIVENEPSNMSYSIMLKIGFIFCLCVLIGVAGHQDNGSPASLQPHPFDLAAIGNGRMDNNLNVDVLWELESMKQDDDDNDEDELNNDDNANASTTRLQHDDKVKQLQEEEELLSIKLNRSTQLTNFSNNDNSNATIAHRLHNNNSKNSNSNSDISSISLKITNSVNSSAIVPKISSYSLNLSFNNSNKNSIKPERLIMITTDKVETVESNSNKSNSNSSSQSLEAEDEDDVLNHRELINSSQENDDDDDEISSLENYVRSSESNRNTSTVFSIGSTFNASSSSFATSESTNTSANPIETLLINDNMTTTTTLPVSSSLSSSTSSPLLRATVSTSSSSLTSSSKRRPKRSVVHLYDMVVCSTGCNPLAYKGYGCYCGFLGSGLIVDGIDKCCAKHDWCYHHAKCPPLMTYFIPYYWTCNDGRPKCVSDYRGWRGICGAHLCECDRQFAECLRKYPCPRGRAVCLSSPFRHGVTPVVTNNYVNMIGYDEPDEIHYFYT